MIKAVLLIVLTSSRCCADKPWEQWLEHFGHDTFRYPAWVRAQRDRCHCQLEDTTHVVCVERPAPEPEQLTWCVARQYLLDRMPDFDKHFMPPSVSVDGQSMFDDNLAFALMTNNASRYASKLPLSLRLPYVLPYASYHEARVGWRALFFAKYFQIVANASSTREAMELLVAPNVFLDWTSHLWPAHPAFKHQTDYTLEWSSSTSPPVINPFAFAAYGYASCSGWATFVTYLARTVGIPARQVGTPCWNSIYEGVDYRGLARDNKNVSLCWGARSADGQQVGGGFLNNHNWVEYWDDTQQQWVFQNVPPTSADPDTGLCNFDPDTGCDYHPDTGCDAVHGGPGAAARDHDIFAVTWSQAGDDAEDGGPLVDAKDLTLSNGESVSPLVWSPRLSSPLGMPLKNVGLRLVNRTAFYRCRAPSNPTKPNP